MQVEQKQENEFVQVLPSRFPVEGYVRLKVRCYCCRQLIRDQDGAEYRKEDLPKLTDSKPLCPHCANHLKEWQKQREVVDQKLKLCQEATEKIEAKIREYHEWLLNPSRVGHSAKDVFEKIFSLQHKRKE